MTDPENELLKTFWQIVTKTGDLFHATDETKDAVLAQVQAEYGAQEIARTERVEGHYAPPELQPDCRCKRNPMRQMFCMTGHLTECHYPLTCRQAQCGHYTQYQTEPRSLIMHTLAGKELFESAKYLGHILAETYTVYAFNPFINDFQETVIPIGTALKTVIASDDLLVGFAEEFLLTLRPEQFSIAPPSDLGRQMDV